MVMNGPTVETHKFRAMKLSVFNSNCTEEVVQLFTEVFSASEGEQEGALIGNLVSEIIMETAPADLIGFMASINKQVVGSIFFSRFILPGDQLAFLLSPVAVSSSRQGAGIGQSLIKFGINDLKSQKVELLFTYGDPGFYRKVGFEPISEDAVQAPLVLSQPEGWLAQSLTGYPVQAISGSTKCIAALNYQKYW